VPQFSARGAALAALRTWRAKKQFADSIISNLLAKAPLAGPDRAFALDLFYGVLRNRTLLDFWIGALRPSAINVDLRDILRLGLYQLFIGGTPEHAAVYETVELAPKKQRPVTNGILRTAARRKAELRERANAQPLHIRASHPEFLISRWKRQFGPETTEWLCAWNNRPPPIYARINQLKIDFDSFAQTYSKSQLVPGLPGFVQLSSVSEGGIERGHSYIQDPSTAIACDLLDPQPGEKVLDACAAPGGKTAYLAELMKNRGLIVACDRDPKRLSLLRENLARLGVGIVKTISHNWAHVRIPQEIRSQAPFDRILVDAPCTNTGVMRRRVDVRWRLTTKEFARMQVCQIKISGAVAPLLKPGGVLAYSTCSLEPEENEHVVRHLVSNKSMLQLEEEKRSLPFRDNFDGAFAAKLASVKS
jgi:16S rRNA (cytosine967-C5)-methyltransferase